MKKIEIFLKILIFNILRFLIKKNKNPDSNHILINKNIKRILILRYDVIGDMLVTIPMIDYLKQEIKNVEIDILASTKNVDIAKGISNLSNIYFFEYNNILKFIKISKTLKKRQYDIIFSIVFNRTTYAAIISNLIASKNTSIVNILHNKRKHIYSKLFDLMVDLDDNERNNSMAEQLLLIAKKSLSLSNNFPDSINLKLSNENQLFALKVFEKIKAQKYLGYNISSGASTRMFSIDKNIEIINQIIKNFPDFQILILSSPNNFSLAEKIQRSCQKTALCPYTNNILNIAAVVQKVNYIVTPDTSIVHIAAAFKIPSLIFFNQNYTKVSDWLPYNSKYVKILTEGKDSLDEITPENVLDGLLRLMNE